MRRTVWTMACAVAVAMCSAQLAGANGQSNETGQDASGFSAAGSERRACTVRTLRGSYVFSATGFNIVGGVQQPKAIVEVIAFHGDNTLDVPAATVSLNRVIIRSFPSFGTMSATATADARTIRGVWLNPPSSEARSYANAGHALVRPAVS
jgi:hypothetical protein